MTPQGREHGAQQVLVADDVEGRVGRGQRGVRPTQNQGLEPPGQAKQPGRTRGADTAGPPVEELGQRGVGGGADGLPDASSAGP